MASNDEGSKVFVVSVMAGVLLLALFSFCAFGLFGMRSFVATTAPMAVPTASVATDSVEVMTSGDQQALGGIEIRIIDAQADPQVWSLDGERVTTEQLIDNIRRRVETGSSSRMRIVRTPKLDADTADWLVQEIRALKVDGYTIVDELDEPPLSDLPADTVADDAASEENGDRATTDEESDAGRKSENREAVDEAPEAADGSSAGRTLSEARPPVPKS